MGLSEGEGIRELRKRLADKVFDGDVTRYRADMIARTEGSRAAHAGENQAWEQSGVVAAKVWRILPGACQYCTPLDGKIIEIGGTYFEQGQVAEGNEGGKMNLNYETVQAPPLHPHCHCDEEPVLREIGE